MKVAFRTQQSSMIMNRHQMKLLQASQSFTDEIITECSFASVLMLEKRVWARFEFDMR